VISRRGFLGALVGGVAAAAAVRTWPFRVFSFPIQVTSPTLDEINAITLRELSPALADNFFVDTPFLQRLRMATLLGSSMPGNEVRITNIEVPTVSEIEAYS
jgi:hypothetical protein